MNYLFLCNKNIFNIHYFELNEINLIENKKILISNNSFIIGITGSNLETIHIKNPKQILFKEKKQNFILFENILTTDFIIYNEKESIIRFLIFDFSNNWLSHRAPEEYNIGVLSHHLLEYVRGKQFEARIKYKILN